MLRKPPPVQQQMHDLIVRLRDRHSIPQRDIARYCGVDPAILSKFLSEQTDLRLSTAVRLMHGLGFDITPPDHPRHVAQDIQEYFQ